MARRTVIGIAAILFWTTATGLYAISWEDIQVTDPISGESVAVSAWRSAGSYIYHFPSKYDAVYWPHTDEQWIWFCPGSGYVSFGDDFSDLTEDEVLRIRDYLSANYDRNTPLSIEEKLRHLEMIYELRDKDSSFWAWLYRVLAVWFDGAAMSNINRNAALALVYRRQALPLIAEMERYYVPGFSKIQQLYLLGEYNRQLGNEVEARIYFARARNTAWQDENGQTYVGNDYLNLIIADKEELLPADVTKNDDEELILAAALGDTEEVSSLLASGADINADSINGNTPVMWASWAGHSDVVRVLLRNGARTDSVSADGSTTLHLAVVSRNPETPRILLDAGVAVDIQDQNGYTALIWASILGQTETGKLLLDAGAASGITDENGLTALDWAANLGHVDVVELFSDSGPVSLIDAEDGVVDYASPGPLVEMVFVEAGTFSMGRADGYAREAPVHQVTISRDFYIGRFEVTVAAFGAFVEDTGYETTADTKGWAYLHADDEWHITSGANWARTNYEQDGTFPVTNVTWHDAVAFCNWLSAREGFTQCYTVTDGDVECDFSADGYRLPTEAEWEYAAVGGKHSKGYVYAGSDDLESVAWFPTDSLGVPHRVGEKTANELGIHDMSGNLWEWCNDMYLEDHYTASRAVDPVGPEEGDPEHRTQRGGGWNSEESDYCRPSYRFGYPTDLPHTHAGFRVVRVKFDDPE
jgi:formylglycine-generating enzyme required for sulfatase activity/ankyrin repeat protein